MIEVQPRISHNITFLKESIIVTFCSYSLYLCYYTNICICIQLFVCVVLDLGVGGRRGVEGGGRERVGRKWVGARGGGAGACLGYYRG